MTISPRRTSSALRVIALAVATTALVASSTLVMADPRDDQHNAQSDHASAQWGQNYGATQHSYHNGDRIGQNDWNNSAPVDYRSHHLNRPPRGYEWREHNGQYVLAAVATGVIMSVILDSGQR
jgi:Ni/Co efflux regulator RcnB